MLVIYHDRLMAFLSIPEPVDEGFHPIVRGKEVVNLSGNGNHFPFQSFAVHPVQVTVTCPNLAEVTFAYLVLCHRQN